MTSAHAQLEAQEFARTMGPRVLVPPPGGVDTTRELIAISPPGSPRLDVNFRLQSPISYTTKGYLRLETQLLMPTGGFPRKGMVIIQGVCSRTRLAMLLTLFGAYPAGLDEDVFYSGLPVSQERMMRHVLRSVFWQDTPVYNHPMLFWDNIQGPLERALAGLAKS